MPQMQKLGFANFRDFLSFPLKKIENETLLTGRWAELNIYMITG